MKASIHLHHFFDVFSLIMPLFLFSCTKEMEVRIDTTEERSIPLITKLSFDSAFGLKEYAESLKSGGSSKQTKGCDQSQGFVSLWDSQQEATLSKLSQGERIAAENEGLVYEPEDSIILDPVFAKIVNPKREVIVGGKTYRYVETGAFVYDSSVCEDYVDCLDPKDYSYLKNKEEVLVTDGVVFVRIINPTPVYAEIEETKLPVVDPGLYDDKLILQDGTTIQGADIRVVEYGKGNGDASGFQKTISSIFGTSVVAEKYFDSTHRMKLRTFSQDFIVYTTVGMTVRMQRKRVGIWWKRDAQEMRYGWSAVECYYSYKGPSFPSGITFQNADVLLHDHTNYYQKPLVLFSVPLVDFQVTDKMVSQWARSLLQKNAGKINKWLNNNPNYKSNPYSVFAADKPTSYSMIFPQYEEVAKGEHREQVNWDFRIHAQAGVKIGGGGITPTFSPVSDPENVEIRRGEIYAAVKYNGQWRACVIVVK